MSMSGYSHQFKSFRVKQLANASFISVWLEVTSWWSGAVVLTTSGLTPCYNSAAGAAGGLFLSETPPPAPPNVGDSSGRCEWADSVHR